jgi:hypothetical protein
MNAESLSLSPKLHGIRTLSVTGHQKSLHTANRFAPVNGSSRMTPDGTRVSVLVVALLLGRSVWIWDDEPRRLFFFSISKSRKALDFRRNSAQSTSPFGKMATVLDHLGS